MHPALARALAPPEDRAEQPAAVEREGGHQVEHPQGRVDEGEPAEEVGDQWRARSHEPEPSGDDRHREAGQGPDPRDQGLRAGALRLAVQARHAPEQPQGDAGHLHTAAPCHQSVGQLVGEQARVERGGAGQRREPVSGSCLAGDLLREQVHREGPRDQAENEDQAPVQADLDAEDLSKPDRRSH